MKILQGGTRPRIAIALGVLGRFACSDGTTEAPYGGGSAGPGSPGGCATASACGGDLTGTWDVVAICQNSSVPPGTNLGAPAECVGAIEAADAGTVTTPAQAQVTFSANGSFATTGAIQQTGSIVYSAACIAAAFRRCCVREGPARLGATMTFLATVAALCDETTTTPKR